MKFSQVKIIFFISSFLLVAVVTFSLFASSITDSTINISKINKVRISGILPEGWAFFTKDPMEANLILYKVTDNNKVVKFTAPFSKSSHLFGLDRGRRVVTQELGRLQEYLYDSLWHPIEGPVEQQNPLIDSMAIVKVPNPSRYPSLTGTYVLQSVEPIPWAWANTDATKYVKSKICKIHVVETKQLAQ